MRTQACGVQTPATLSGHFLDQPLLRTPVANNVNAVPQDVVDRVIGRMSLGIGDLRDRIKAMQAYNINWAYLFDPLRTWPMIDLGNGRLFCPMPTLLLWRMTKGVYFDLVPHRQLFDRHFGLAFQDLIGEVVTAADPQGRLTLLAEERYGSRQRPRDSADWIVDDGTASLSLKARLVV